MCSVLLLLFYLYIFIFATTTTAIAIAIAVAICHCQNKYRSYVLHLQYLFYYELIQTQTQAKHDVSPAAPSPLHRKSTGSVLMPTASTRKTAESCLRTYTYAVHTCSFIPNRAPRPLATCSTQQSEAEQPHPVGAASGSHRASLELVGGWEGPPCVLVPPAVWCPPAAPPRCCVPPCGGRVPRVLPPPAVGSCHVCWCPPAVLWPRPRPLL